jgi:hypothetical protein
MIKLVYKDDLTRMIPSGQVAYYLSNGWKERKAEDVINLKPVTKVQAVTEKEPGNAIDNKGD